MKIRAIIPACGLGTRMNMPINKSKELLPHPLYNTTLIGRHFYHCKQVGIEPLVITRQEKTDLIDYCALNQVECVIQPLQGEWVDTVLNSSSHWFDRNCLILPDTIYRDYNDLAPLVKHQELGSKIVVGYHDVTDPEKWGIVQDYQIIEKPNHQKLTPQSSNVYQAWGTLGFNKSAGLELFTGLKQNKWYNLKDASFYRLINFKDVTRGT